MFKTAEKTELNQISLTGLRALVFIGLLIMKPHSLDEIREILIELKIMEKTHSNDILRIDLNTIKLMGCEICRSSAKTNFRYVLTKHPFGIKLTNEEVAALKRAYNAVKQNLKLDSIIQYHELFNKIAFHICDSSAREAMLGISTLKYYDIGIIKALINDCENKNTLELAYEKANSNIDSIKKIVAQEVVYKNDKVYLYGFDLDKNEAVVLNLKRIKKIIKRKNQNEDFEMSLFKVTFILKDLKQDDLETNEDILDKIEQGHIIEGHYHNEFIAMQRMLAFGSRCIVLEPTEFKTSIIEKIKEMRKAYGN